MYYELRKSLFTQFPKDMETIAGLALAMWPLKAESFKGDRDLLKVNTWIYTTNQYCMLVQESAATMITDVKNVRYAF